MADQEKLKVQSFTMGDWQTNCYVVSVPGGDCWVVDAGFSPQPMIDYIHNASLKPVHLLLTHGHLDHLAGLETILNAFAGLPVAIDQREQSYPTSPTRNLSAHMDHTIEYHGPLETFTPGMTLQLGDLSWTILDTAGHSPGGVTFYCEEAAVALVGDALFAGSIGRYDLPGSDGLRLARNIQKHLMNLPDATRVYPGHGPATTIGQERAQNPYLRSPGLL